MQSIPILTLSLAVTSAITAERFATLGGAPATAGGNAGGVARSDGAVGELIPLDVLGTAVVTAGAAVAKDAAIEVGTAGKAITKTTGVAVARALEAAAADGDRIEVMLIPN